MRPTTDTITETVKALRETIRRHQEEGAPAPDLRAAVETIDKERRRMDAANRVQLPLMLAGTQGQLI